MADNKSVPLRCSHEKLLVIRSVVASAAIPASEKAKLAKLHLTILTEPSYAGGGLF